MNPAASLLRSSNDLVTVGSDRLTRQDGSSGDRPGRRHPGHSRWSQRWIHRPCRPRHQYRPGLVRPRPSFRPPSRRRFLRLPRSHPRRPLHLRLRPRPPHRLPAHGQNRSTRRQATHTWPLRRLSFALFSLRLTMTRQSRPHANVPMRFVAGSAARGSDHALRRTGSGSSGHAMPLARREYNFRQAAICRSAN